MDEAAPATAAGRSALLELQRALSPTLPAVDGLPLSARYLPGKDAGQLPGDWYDAIALDGGDVALVVGNVAGGDLVAAALMCQLRSAVRAYAMEGHPPSVVVGRANEFHLGLGADRQARLAYALVHPADRIVTLVRAGHVPPMLAGGESAPCFLDGAGGPPLGVQPGEVWRETTVQLPAGSALVLYTDGLLGDDESVEDGMARLIDAVKGGRTDSAAALMDALVALVGDSAPTETAVLIGHLATAATGPPAELRRTLPPTAESATVARWLVTDLLRDAADPDALDTAALLTTELVSNAIRHTGDELTLTVRLEAGMLRVGVSDTSHRRPQLVQAGTRDTSGRGLHLVEALADRWGVDPDGRGLGKTVWFELAAPPV